MTAAFAKILKQSGQTPLTPIQSDDGREFKNAKFRALLKKRQIHLFSTKGDTKASVIERFNRTFKRSYRSFTAANVLDYLGVFIVPPLTEVLKEFVTLCTMNRDMLIVSEQ